MELSRLFGPSAKTLTILCWTAIVLACSSAIIPLGFILYEIVGSYGAAGGIDGIIGTWFDSRNVTSLGNSLFIGVAVSLTLSVASVVAALLLRWCCLTGSKLIYTLAVIPLMIPDYVFGVAGRILFDPTMGLLAGWLPVTILLNRGSALGIVVFITLIKWFPVSAVVADSTILALRQPVLDQAALDFTNFKRAAFLVYLPQICQILPVVLSFGFLVGFRQQELAYELTSSGGGFVAETWGNWNYRVAFEFAAPARAATDALLTLIILLAPIYFLSTTVARDVISDE